MPYSTDNLSELPDSLKHYPASAKKVFVKVFNENYQKTKSERLALFAGLAAAKKAKESTSSTSKSANKLPDHIPVFVEKQEYIEIEEEENLIELQKQDNGLLEDYLVKAKMLKANTIEPDPDRSLVGLAIKQANQKQVLVLLFSDGKTLEVILPETQDINLFAGGGASARNTFTKIITDSGEIIADSPNTEISILGGTNTNVVASGNTITINSQGSGGSSYYSTPLFGLTQTIDSATHGLTKITGILIEKATGEIVSCAVSIDNLDVTIDSNIDLFGHTLTLS